MRSNLSGADLRLEKTDIVAMGGKFQRKTNRNVRRLREGSTHPHIVVVGTLKVLGGA